MNRLKGKIALVTGAGRMGNIGVAICEAFLREGAAGVFATDIRAEEVQAITDRMAPFGRDRFKFAQHDVTSEEDWERIVGELRSTFGHLDILVNNAGVGPGGGLFDTTLDSLRKTMAINHDSIFLGSRACAPLLESAISRHPGGGAIVNNVSMASYMPSAHNLAYQVSKAAARMLTLCAAAELGPKRIRVNSVHPGMTLTPMLREGFESYVDRGVWQSVEEAERSLAAMAPLNISSVAEDTAHAFVYLASDEARFVTGAALYHDGGLGRHY